MAQKNIDIPLNGVGGVGRARRGRNDHTPGSRIDIPVRGVEVQARGGMGTSLGASTVKDEELEFVNRHHREVKALHRRAREQNGG